MTTDTKIIKDVSCSDDFDPESLLVDDAINTILSTIKEISDETEIEIKEGSGNVIIVDDVLATGGTLQATNDLAKMVGYDVIDNLVLINLQSVPRSEIFDLEVRSLIQYE